MRVIGAAMGTVVRETQLLKIAPVLRSMSIADASASFRNTCLFGKRELRIDRLKCRNVQLNRAVLPGCADMLTKVGSVLDAGHFSPPHSFGA